MAVSKKQAENKKQADDVFTKEQLVKSKRYMSYVDFLNGNLQENKTYTIKQVDELISGFYGKGKSE